MGNLHYFLGGRRWLDIIARDALGILFILVLSSCGNEDVKYHVGVSLRGDGITGEPISQFMMQEASLYPELTLSIKTAGTDTLKQADDIETFINEGVDLLIVTPHNDKRVISRMEEAYRKGIPVILFNRRVLTDDYTAYVGPDNEEIGKMLGEYVDGCFQENASIVALREKNESVGGMERYNGLLSYASKGSGNNVSIIGQLIIDSEREDVEKQILDGLNSIVGDKSSALAIVTFTNSLVYSAYESLSKMDLESPPIILGVNSLSGIDRAISLVEDGVLTCSISHMAGAEVAVSLAHSILSGESYQRNNIMNSAVLDKSIVPVIRAQRTQLIQRLLQLEKVEDRLSSALHRQTRQIYFLYSFLFIAVLAIALSIFVLKQKAETVSLYKNLEIKNQKLEMTSEMLQNTEKSRMNLLTSISHEIKTPLTLIIKPTENLLREKELSKIVRSSLDVIYLNSCKLYDIITELLDYQKITSEKPSESGYVYGALETCLLHINTLFSRQIKEKKINFSYANENPGKSLYYDQEKLGKTYLNLLSSVLQHADMKTSVSVMVSFPRKAGKQWYCITVGSSRCYMSDQDILNLSKELYEVESAYDSSSLGLTLARQYVEVMGGSLNAKSDLDHGTEFTIIVPENIPAATSGKAEMDAIYGLSKLNSVSESDMGVDQQLYFDDSDKEKVLVIDDSKDMREYIKNLLNDEYVVICARSGEDGVEKAKTVLPDIILCDTLISGKNGYWICRTLKGNKRTAEIPFIFLTASSVEEQIINGYNVGSDGYIEKPFSVEILRTVIKNTLEKATVIKQLKKNNILGLQDDSETAQSSLLTQIKQYVEQHLNERVTIDDLARETALSKSTLYRKLKESTNYSPIDIINIIKLRYSVKLMLSGKSSLSIIAKEAGFNSLSYYSRTFNRYFGISPKEWLEDNK